jgi:hypothetical protein
MGTACWIVGAAGADNGGMYIFVSIKSSDNVPVRASLNRSFFVEVVLFESKSSKHTLLGSLFSLLIPSRNSYDFRFFLLLLLLPLGLPDEFFLSPQGTRSSKPSKLSRLLAWTIVLDPLDTDVGTKNFSRSSIPLYTGWSFSSVLPLSELVLFNDE